MLKLFDFKNECLTESEFNILGGIGEPTGKIGDSYCYSWSGSDTEETHDWHDGFVDQCSDKRIKA